MTDEASQWPAWPGEIDLGKLAETLGDDGLWAHREHARFIDRMCRDLANSPVSLIEYCQRGFPDRFEECVLKEERRRLSSGKPMHAPGIPAPHSAWQIAQLEAERTDRLARSENSIQFAAAQRVARDVRLQFLKHENALADRARTLMARPDYHFVGVRGEMLSDRIAPRFADKVVFDWLRSRVVVPSTGQIYRAEEIVWEHVYVSSPSAMATLGAPAPNSHPLPESAAPPGGETKSPQSDGVIVHPPAKRGRPSKERKAVEAALAELHPNGVPPDCTVDSLVAELKARGVKVSPSTVNRALGRRSD